MIPVIILLCVLIALILLWILAIGGRKKPEMKPFLAFDYAHRGLHDKPTVPENSIDAFVRAIQGGYGSELDVHLLKDGGLAVIHDSLLVRTTGAEGKIEDLTTADLKKYRLEGTNESIPTLQEVLSLYEKSGLPLLIELKPAGNCAALCQKVCDVLDEYEGSFLLESFDPRCLMWLKKHRPDILRGQLAQNFLHHGSGYGKILDFALTSFLLNFLTRPDFVAYKFEDRRDLPNRLCGSLWKLAGASWTIVTREQYDQAKAEGLMPIFEKFKP